MDWRWLRCDLRLRNYDVFDAPVGVGSLGLRWGLVTRNTGVLNIVSLGVVLVTVAQFVFVVIGIVLQRSDWRLVVQRIALVVMIARLAGVSIRQLLLPLGLVLLLILCLAEACVHGSLKIVASPGRLLLVLLCGPLVASVGVGGGYPLALTILLPAGGLVRGRLVRGTLVLRLVATG